METKPDKKRNPFARKLTFPLGSLCATPGALAALAPDEQLVVLSRHARGDWGDVDDEDWNENDLSVAKGFRLLSVYAARSGQRVWVITEADRSATTILLPEEY